MIAALGTFLAAVGLLVIVGGIVLLLLVIHALATWGDT